jgi:hypothetical protein
MKIEMEKLNTELENQSKELFDKLDEAEKKLEQFMKIKS